MKKSIFIIFILFLLYFIFYSFSYAHSISTELKDKLFRLHIIANSDSYEDQQLKLYVRDNLLKYLSQYNFKTKNELISFLHTNEAAIKEIISSSITEKGFNYNFSLKICNSYFPKKDYLNISTPAGYYDCLKIEIGNAEGKNWWCMLFPPMCLINSTTCSLSDESETLLENSLSTESSSVLFSENTQYQLKFKIIDIINSIK